MTKRALYTGQRVHTRFWNEVTVRDWGKGETNPFIRTATVVSVSGGRVRLAFDPTMDPDQMAISGPHYSGAYEHTVPAFTVHRGEPEDGPDPALVWRENTWRSERNPQQQTRWDYRFSWWAREQKLTFRQYLRRLRDTQVRWHDSQAAQQRVQKAATERRKYKTAMAFLVEQLRTPMTFPPGHPGCDEPIYPLLHSNGMQLGDGWRCRTHGDVTAAVMHRYYPPASPTRKPRQRA